MPSSTSSSEARKVEVEAPLETHGEPLGAGLRLTASDRPGVAQPVPERDVPDQPWRAISLAVMALTLLLTAGWEWQMRRIGLTPGDYGEGPSFWAAQRRRVDAEDPRVVIVGDSRILFDTDLGLFERLTGTRPIQLAVAGGNPRYLLDDISQDAKFRGLLIVGLADTQIFRPKPGYEKRFLERFHHESPAQHVSYLIDRVLRGGVAFLEDDYEISSVIAKADTGWRKGVDSPYEDIWKLSTAGPDRQTRMWAPIESPGYLQAHARYAWRGFKRPRVNEKVRQAVLADVAAAVARIRARGGEVVFVRPPSAPQLRVNEEASVPKAIGWDALLSVTRSKGVHVDELGAAPLVSPEYSHLSKACAPVFTDAYVRRLSALTPRLKLKPDAPAPLPLRCA